MPLPRHPKISIHALREESDHDVAEILGLRTISIHALREESDMALPYMPSLAIIFQSTLSVRRATGDYVGVHDVFHISIHALREESDVLWPVVAVLEPISIHALREESDATASPPKPRGKRNFNPRSP